MKNTPKLFENATKVGALYFDLSTHEGRTDMRLAQAASDLHNILTEIDNEVFRKRIKYESEQYSDEQMELLEKLRTEINNIILEACPEFYDLTY